MLAATATLTTCPAPQLPRGKRPDNNMMKVRMSARPPFSAEQLKLSLCPSCQALLRLTRCGGRAVLPMSVRCSTCGTYMYKGTKFNTRKEDVEGEDYLGIQARSRARGSCPYFGSCSSAQLQYQYPLCSKMLIAQVFRFYFRCSACAAELTMKTDPANSDYTMERGGTRNYEPWRDKERTVAEAIAAREEEEKGNAMKVGSACACCDAGTLPHICCHIKRAFWCVAVKVAYTCCSLAARDMSAFKRLQVQLKPFRVQLALSHCAAVLPGAGEPHAGQQAGDGHHERAGRDAVAEQAARARGHRRRAGRAPAQRRQRAGAPTALHLCSTALGLEEWPHLYVLHAMCSAAAACTAVLAYKLVSHCCCSRFACHSQDKLCPQAHAACGIRAMLCRYSARACSQWVFCGTALL